ncbi:MAG: SDR family oxidoreductase [Actinobacteria bacterium]|jgi:NAD(P)-dependent dehydrogenase (short-subunit alcohol dehydrogenase family)|nr:MAG: SDR family oxidoreductase [Actinomycetota bacterium]
MAEIGFQDRVAVITGAGGGIGKAYALMLAERGAKVVVNDLGGAPDGSGADTTPAQQVVDEIKAAGGEAIANGDSVSDEAGAARIIEAAVDNFGKIDILINNAGILRDKSILKMETADFEKVLSVHLMGTFFCTRAAFRHMRENAYGRIVSTVSAAGLYGNFGQTNYGAAKLGIVGFMKCVKQEGAKYNIMANCVAPVAFTRLTTGLMPDTLSEKLAPEYVAPMTLWLASEKCDVSGAVFIAGGGYFSRTEFVEGPGVWVPISPGMGPEVVEENKAQIMDLAGGSEFGATMEEATKVMAPLLSG